MSIKRTANVAGVMDKFFGSQSLGDDLLEIALEDLVPMTNHPFSVVDDKEMDELVASIKDKGVLEAGVARELPDGKYQIVSGHRRARACKLAGLKSMTFHVVDMTEDEAIVAMVDANLHREHIKISERAAAYKMKLESLKKMRKEGRAKMTEEALEELKGKSSLEVLAKNSPDGPTQIGQLLRVMELTPELKEKVDNGQVPIKAAVSLSYLPEEEQQTVNDALGTESISVNQAKAIKEKADQKIASITEADVKRIVDKPVPKNKCAKAKNITLKEAELKGYFTSEWTAEEITTAIKALIKERLSEFLENYQK